MMEAPEQDAPPGTVWVCRACGKRSSNRYNATISAGWDESCMLNAVLCDEKSLKYKEGSSQVTYADPWPEETTK